MDNTLSKKYSKAWFRSRKSLFWRVPLFCDGVMKVLPGIKSVIDIGCGNGDLITGFAELYGCRVLGVDGSEWASHYNALNRFLTDKTIPFRSANKDLSLNDIYTLIEILDIRIGFSKKSLGLTMTTDLVMCLEVIEHIEPEYEGIILDSICGLESKYIIFSGANPRQKGIGHANCRSKVYWIGQLESRGYKLMSGVNGMIIEVWKSYGHSLHLKKGLLAYTKNMIVLEREGEKI